MTSRQPSLLDRAWFLALTTGVGVALVTVAVGALTPGRVAAAIDPVVVCGAIVGVSITIRRRAAGRRECADRGSARK